MAEATRQGMLLILVAVLGLLGSFRGVFGVAMGVVLAKCIFCISMTRLALSISNIRLIEWLSAMRTGVIGCVVMGLSILAAKYFLRECISSGLLFLVIACIGVLAYVGAIRVCLSSEDSKLIDLVSGILPSRLGNVLRFMFGTNPRSQGQKLDNSTPALPRT
jgi:hypothetical protein